MPIDQCKVCCASLQIEAKTCIERAAGYKIECHYYNYHNNNNNSSIICICISIFIMRKMTSKKGRKDSDYKEPPVKIETFGSFIVYSVVGWIGCVGAVLFYGFYLLIYLFMCCRSS